MRNECRLEIKGWADMEKLMRAMKEMTERERVIRSEKNSHREAETESKKQKEVRVRERGTCVVHIKWLD